MSTPPPVVSFSTSGLSARPHPPAFLVPLISSTRLFLVYVKFSLSFVREEYPQYLFFLFTPFFFVFLCLLLATPQMQCLSPSFLDRFFFFRSSLLVHAIFSGISSPGFRKNSIFSLNLSVRNFFCLCLSLSSPLPPWRNFPEA